jgi:hypothetical protein
MDIKELQIQHTKSFVICECPKCGLEHKIKMIWIGKGLPRKYCSQCNSIVKNIVRNAFIFD